MTIKYTTYATPRLAMAEAFNEYLYDPSRFIGALALALYRSPVKAASFSTIPIESLLKRADAKRATGGAYNRIQLVAEDGSFACEEKGLEMPLFDDDVRLYASDLDARLATLQHIASKLLTELEIVTAALLFNTSTWTGATLYTDHSAAPWDNIATDILGQCLAANEKVRALRGVNPDTLIIGAAQVPNICKNTGIKAMFPGVAMLTLPMIGSSLAAVLGYSRILVGKGVYDSTDENVAPTITDIWSDDYAMVAVTAPEGAPLTTPCVGRTVLWTPDSPDLLTTDLYREEQTRADVYRGRHSVQAKVLDANFAHLMKIDA